MILVDDAYLQRAVQWRGRWFTARWCHLLTDQDDPAELHAFAASIGMPRSWFQPGYTPAGGPDPTRDHYDVTEERRRRAVAAGATEIPQRVAAEMRLRRRRRHASMESR